MAGDERMAQAEASDARAIGERLLRRTGDAMLAGDFEAFSACFTLPMSIDTFMGTTRVSTREEFRRVFEAARAFYEDRGIDQLERWIVDADFTGEATISAHHRSVYLSKGEIAGPQTSVLAEMKLVDGEWLIADTAYATTSEGFTAALSPAMAGASEPGGV